MSIGTLAVAFETLSEACTTFDTAMAAQTAAQAAAEALITAEIQGFLTALGVLQTARAAAQQTTGFPAAQEALQAAGVAKSEALSAYAAAFEAFKTE